MTSEPPVLVLIDRDAPLGDWMAALDSRWDGLEEELAELRAAADPPALRRLLREGGSCDSTWHHEAVELFRSHHDTGDDRAGAVETAWLLCTHRRWHRCTARLLSGILDTGVLDDDGQDALAERFWRSEGVSRFGPVRYVAPPLRRWATARLLAGGRLDLDAAVARARELAAAGFRGGDQEAAVIGGVLDAADALDEAATRRTVEIGRASGKGPVRLRALEVLAELDGPERARRLARADGDAKVRRWGNSGSRRRRA